MGTLTKFRAMIDGRHGGIVQVVNSVFVAASASCSQGQQLVSVMRLVSEARDEIARRVAREIEARGQIMRVSLRKLESLQTGPCCDGCLRVAVEGKV
jgi:hypothetical protein